MAAMSQYLNLRPDVPKASDQVGGEVTAYTGSLRPKDWISEKQHVVNSNYLQVGEKTLNIFYPKYSVYVYFTHLND